MPEKLILRDVSIMVDGQTLTTAAREVDITESGSEQDVTAFGGNGYSEFDIGMKTGEITVTFFQGFDASGVHETLYPIWQANDEVELRIGPKGDSGATDNPVWVGMVKLFSYSFLRGAVGEASTNPVTFRLTGPPTLNTT